MENLYFFVTMCELWQKNDPHQFLHHYFIDGGGFLTCFLIALGAAIIGAALFYGWIGMQSNKLSNVPTWLVTLAAVALVTLALTHISVIGSLDSNTGFFDDLTTYKSTLQQNIQDDAQLAQFNSEVTQIREAMDKGCDVVYSLDLGNAIIAVVLFLVISLCVKRFTVHAVAIPFEKP